VDVEVNNEEKYLRLKNVAKAPVYSYEQPVFKGDATARPLVIGLGPAGLFAALVLARSGARPIVIERGARVEDRERDIQAFFKHRRLNPDSNVQFGEGGAGTFSDGKLTTNIKDKRCRFVINELVKAGAPREIAYLAKPHIGTDILRDVVRNIREEIISLGGKIRFNTKLEDISIVNDRVTGVLVGNEEIAADNVILAIGHSARDTFELIRDKGIAMEQKPFAMGVRIEHRQEDINKAQYGDFAKYLPPADYKLFTHLENGRGVYTFCMCPGGVVVAAASEEGHLVTNGMSYYARDKANANSALLVGISPEDFGSSDVLAGVKLQRGLERAAYIEGGSDYNAPVQLVGDFLKGRATTAIGDIQPSYSIGVKCADFKNIFPEYMYRAMQEGILSFDKKLKGFANPSAVMTAVESRSSSPVRIVRGSSLESVSVSGLYPCGEGCGYAGGIMSAAVDGVRCAEALLNKMI
jgi:hypothetical protein